MVATEKFMKSFMDFRSVYNSFCLKIFDQRCRCFKGMRDKTADFRVRQNSQFWKRDNIADFDNETKPPIWKWDKTADLL